LNRRVALVALVFGVTLVAAIVVNALRPTAPSPPSHGSYQLLAQTLDPLSQPSLSYLSCPTALDCVAGGDYKSIPTQDLLRPLVVTEVDGAWQTPISISLPDRVNGYVVPGFTGWVSSVSCSSPGNCLVGGIWGVGTLGTSFLLFERDGIWGDVQPGVEGFHQRIPSTQTEVACPANGDCYAVVQEGVAYANTHTYLIRYRHWRREPPIPLSISGDLLLESLSCASTTNCIAGGTTNDGIVNRRVPKDWSSQIVGADEGRVTLTTQPFQSVCPLARLCFGWMEGGQGSGLASNFGHDFLVSARVDGIRSEPQSTISVGVLARYKHSFGADSIGDVACASRSACLASLTGAVFFDGKNLPTQVFLISSFNGRSWSSAVLLSAALGNLSNAPGVQAMQCPTPKECVLVGSINLGLHTFRPALYGARLSLSTLDIAKSFESAYGTPGHESPTALAYGVDAVLGKANHMLGLPARLSRPDTGGSPQYRCASRIRQTRSIRPHGTRRMRPSNKRKPFGPTWLARRSAPPTTHGSVKPYDTRGPCL